jgi:hypothetical protein
VGVLWRPARWVADVDEPSMQDRQEAAIAGLKALGPRRLRLTPGQRQTIVSAARARAALARRRRALLLLGIMLVGAGGLMMLLALATGCWLLVVANTICVVAATGCLVQVYRTTP